jgi:hypothetical protein
MDYSLAGRIDELDPVLLQDTLTPEQRKGLGRIHPSFMGGEYLPDSLLGEVEISRIELASTTSDTISVRARPLGRTRIAYRIVDEYPEDGTLSCSPKTSRRPLTLSRLIGLLDNGKQSGGDLVGGFALGYNNMNAESSDRANLRHFTRISSDIYRDLGAHYEHVFEDWVAEDPAVSSERE